MKNYFKMFTISDYLFSDPALQTDAQNVIILKAVIFLR